MKKESYLRIRHQLDFNFKAGALALYFAVDLGLAALTGLLLYQKSAVAWLAVVPFLVLIFRNFGLMHEASHGIAHPNPKINSALGTWSGILSFLPFALWRKTHLEHHYWAGNYHKDPALEIVKRFPSSPKPLQKVLNFCWQSRLPLGALMQYLVFWGHAVVLWSKNPRNPHHWLSLFWPFTVWAGVGYFLDAGQLGILAVSFGLYLFTVEQVNFPHHAGAYLDPEQGPDHEKVWNQHQVTRTCVYPRFVEKLLTLNFNYHIEHHLFPDLPWHQLPRAHVLLKESEIGGDLQIITHSWLEKKRGTSFEKFLFPETPAKTNERKAA